MVHPVTVVGCVLIMMVCPAAAQELSIELKGIPPQLGLPLPDGENLVLTAEISGGSPREVWLARGPDAKVRVLLTRVAAGKYQVNLADRDVVSVLTSHGTKGQFQIFARSPNGSLSSSISVQFGPYRAQEIEATSLYRSGGKWFVIKPGTWCDPETVEELGVTFSARPRAPHVRVEIGEDSRVLTASNNGLQYSLKATPVIRERWRKSGALRLIYGKVDSEQEMLVLRPSPARLDLLYGDARFKISQRNNRPIPGSRGYFKLCLGDITAGQVLIDIRAGTQVPIRSRSVKPGDRVEILLGRHTYTLLVASLVNFPIGVDYGIFVIYEKGISEKTKIYTLIAMARDAFILYFEGETQLKRAWMERHLLDSLLEWKEEKKTLEGFIQRVAGPGAKRRFEVRSPGQKRMRPMATWLREQAQIFEP